MNKINSHINTTDNSEPILINIDELHKKYPVLKENSLDNNVLIDEKVFTEVFAENDFGNLFMILLGADSSSLAVIIKKIIWAIENISEENMLKKYVNSDFVSLFNDNNLDTDLITDIDEFVTGFIKTTFNNSIKNFNVVYKLILSLLKTPFIIISIVILFFFTLFVINQTSQIVKKISYNSSW